ncbi:hypothetical protein VOLCADRAFT_88405 [Volvox carteri f. nagariensis]|uniref:1-phosphatidylinositol-3-phosphate 5-kinase n=1 Tax=Volvox carteri f. nagariensis TaxID=3068 RepID=D8TN95_VOLCA|nr:uncharacterized protein VOLCADRAFT_88405 [Volvox carteri f. nagariensis]EFJ51101.1 hypothetical protein VOLCADRAFT_88405 [Volvox carteri f. nagariensis]|eukprot:XP_002948113.1 hypothetical protein VOLCADRAFT_88405 [Volvox carteri f. nagariensis]
MASRMQLLQLPGADFVAGVCCSDGSTTSLAGSRYRIGAFFSRWSRHSSVHRVSSGDLSWTVPPPLEDDFGMSLADRDARLLYQQQLEAGLLAPDAQPKANCLWEVHRQLLCQAADAHLRAVVQQLLMAESVPQPEVWAPIVSTAAQAVAAYLSPSQMFANNQHDPRQSLKIKKVADVGRPEDTCVVTGVVVCKGLVHRKMRTYVEYPKVLLLMGSLDYQRDPSKLSSFDHMDHDKQYLANAVARLSVMKPDVLLVEGSVARMAQEDLLSRNISVAQNIKARVLERLARAMGISVAPTVEHLNPGTVQKYLGDCKVFRVKAETINVKARASEPADVVVAAAVEPTRARPRAGTPTARVPSRRHPEAERIHGRLRRGRHTAPTPSHLHLAAKPIPGRPPAASLETPVPQASADQQVLTTAGEHVQGAAAAGSEGTASEPALQPAADDQQAKYTSLSAAMMMKALGSGPNAAAAVALVSAGSGALPSVMAFRPWASSVSSAVPTTPAPALGASAASAGGQGGPSILGTDARNTQTAAPSAQPAPHRGVGRMVTLMYFEGCRPINSTVLLKGAGLEVLRKLKSVVSFAVLTAWNQRLESAFLADLLTAAVASAGEEAYSAWATATNTSIHASVSTNAAASSLPSGVSSLGPVGPGAAQMLSMPSMSSASFSYPSLSLAFFRQHAEQAIHTSLVSASASGIPGILLSISPHCNAWDESLIAEWEQQGFTFPHLQHNHHHHHHHHNYTHGHGHGHGRQSQRSLKTGPQTQAQPQQEQEQQLQPQQQQAVDELNESPGQAGDAGTSTAAAAAAKGALAVATDADADAAGGVLQGEPTLAIACGGDSKERAVQQPVPAEGDGSGAGQRQQLQQQATARDRDPGGLMVQPDFVPGPSATTLMSPFIAAAAAAAASITAAAEPILAPQEECMSAGGPPEVPAALGAAGQPGGLATETLEPLDVGAASAAVAVAEVPEMPQSDIVVTEVAGQAARTQSAAADAWDGDVGTQPQSGEREQQQQLSRPSPPQEQQSQQQDAVMVLQGQRIYSHQRIFVTCMFRRSRDRNLCDPFQVKQIDYYHRSSDVPLIRYIKMCTQLGWTCPGLGCPEPFTAHESVFFFGCHKLTVFYSTLPPIQALPGEERNQIWHWTRPIGRGREGAASCRRVPLSQDACYISMGRFLELSFSADGLDVFGRSLHYDHVRYFGLGRTLVCMFPERTSVYVMQLPDVVMSYSQQAQFKWLRQEGAELVQEASDALDLIELMLAESPHFSGGGGVAATASGAAAVAATAAAGSSNTESSLQQASTAGGDAASGDATAASTATAGVTPGSSPGAAPSAAAGLAAAAASSVLAPLLVAVRKDRQSFISLVADCLARCAPSAPPHSGGPSSSSVPWDELVISGVRELNRLRCVLAKAVLQWASRLQDPAGFMAHYNRVTSGGGAGNSGGGGGGGAGRQPTHPQLLEQPGVQMSEGSMSLFGSTSPAVAAYRLGLMPGQFVTTTAPPSETASFTSGTPPDLALEPPHPQLPQAADNTAAHALPIPIVPHMNGPLSVHAVAEMVAQQELRGGGELLEGSRALLGAVGGPAVAVMTTAAAAQQGTTDRPGHSRGDSRSELLPGSAATAGASSSLCNATEGAAASMSPGLPSQSDGGAAASASGRAASQAAGPGLFATGSSSKRLSLLGRLSTSGGGIPGLDAAGGGAAMGGATHTPGPGGLVVGALAGPRGSSLPRSASVSTIGDMGDLSYLAGISGDSGVEDNDDGEEGREDADDEDPDHDTFLAFMGSAPSGAAAFQAGTGGRGSGGVAAGGRLATGAGRGGVSGDSGDDVADEVADGAYYYRALFSHGVGGEGAADSGATPQPLLQAPQPLLPAEPLQLRKVQHHPLVPHDEEEQGQGQHRLRVNVPNGQSSAPVPNSSPPPSAAVLPPVGVAASGAVAQSQGGLAGAHVPVHHPTAPFPITAAGAMPLVPATESFGGAASGGPDAAGGAAAVTTFSRRQLMVQVKRRLESVAAATIGGNTLARGFIPLPGRATLPPGVNDTSIPIFDSEPTSIIAYALSTRAYQQQINAGYKAIFGKARAESHRERERDREPVGTALGPMPGTSEQSQPPLHNVAAVGTPSGSQGATPTGSTGVAAGASAGGPTQGTGTAASGSSGQGATAGPGPGSTCVAASATAAGPTTQVTSTAAWPPQPQPPAAAVPPPPLPAGQLGASPDAEWWTVLTSKEACHVRVAFEDEARSMPWARARFTVTAHFAPQFAELRRRCIQGGEAAFVASMCRCKRWESRGGKSNAYFAKTRDERYIIKSLSKSEKASFMNFAPHYFAHMGRHLLNRDSPTCLAKILGVYSVTFKPQPGTAALEGAIGGGAAGMAAGAALIKELRDREFSQDLLVMENCFYDRPVARIYDLKGSERNRFNADAASRPEDHLEVHLDDNLRRTMHTNPIFVDARSRHQMEAAVWADTGFLAGQDVMDYSLLVGVDKENGVLALAIIDFIRQYTWDKQLETWVKSSGMLGGNGKEPTIISPKQYMRRFRAAMQQYFTAVPGSGGSEVPKDPDAVA